MEVEKQPEPIPLGVAKELLEKELSSRENRLRCVDCGSFQAVPDVEPDNEKSDSEDEAEEYTGPICAKCGSQRLVLIEQIQYEHKLALDHVRLITQATPEQGNQIIGKVIELEHVNDYYASKIVDVLPMHPDDVRSIFARERFSLGRDEIDTIISAVKETMGE
ncbi:MAG: hypothetical protein VXX45_02305 [Candidatus Thermoplasmatota archaeon]|nr:hypothetical protein [Candidatus Thermoplasmatota archaeon]